MCISTLPKFAPMDQQPFNPDDWTPLELLKDLNRRHTKLSNDFQKMNESYMTQRAQWKAFMWIVGVGMGGLNIILMWLQLAK